MGSRPPQRTYRRGGGRGGGGSSSGSNRRERKRSDSGEEIVNKTNGWDLILRDDDDILTGDLRKYNIDPVTRVIRRPGPSINPAAREAHQRVINEIMAEEAERAKQEAMKEQQKKENRRDRRGGGGRGWARGFSSSENGEQQQRGSSSSGAYSQSSPGFGGFQPRLGGGGAAPFDFDRRFTSGRGDTAAPSSFGSLTPQHLLPHRDPSPYGRRSTGPRHQNAPFHSQFDDAAIRGGGGGSFNGSNGHFGGNGPPTLQEPPPPWQRQYTPAPSPFQGHPDYAAIRESVLRELDGVLCNHCRYCRCRSEFRHGTAVEQNHHQQQLQLPYQPQQSDIDSASLHGYASNEFQTSHDQTSLRSTNSRLNREPPFRPIDATWPAQQAQNQEGPNATATEGELNYQRDNASATWDNSADGIRRGVDVDNREQIHGQPQDDCMLAAENTVFWEADVERAAAYRQVEEFRHGADPRTEYRRPDYERYGLGAEGREEPVMNYDGSIASSSEPRTDWTTNSSSGSSRGNRRKNNNNKKKKGRNSTSEGCRPATDLRKDDSEDDDGKDGWRGRGGGGGGGTHQGGTGGGGHTTQGVGALIMAVERIVDLDGVDAAEDLDDERMQPCCSRYDTSTAYHHKEDRLRRQAMVYSYASRSSSYARSAYNEDMVNRRQRKQRQLQQEQFDETPAKEDQEKENEEAAEVAQQQMAEMNLDRLAKEKASSSSAARSSPPVELPPTFYTIAKKIEPALREGKRTVELVTNVWPVEAEDRLVYRYDVSLGIEIVGDNAAGDQTRRIVSMNKGAMDDAAYIERAEFCRLVLLHALESYGVLREMGAIAHDGAATIYSNANLDTVLKPHHWTLDVRVTDLPEAAKKLIRNKNAQNIVIEIQRCREGSQYFNIKDLHAAINTDKSNVDSSLKQFYEVVTSAYGISKTSDFTLYRGGKLYEHKKNGSPNPATRDIGTGHERVPGLMKGVTFVEGTDAADRRKQSRAVAALVLDSTVATFFKQLDLVASLCELNGWRYPKQAVWTGDVIRRTNEFLKNVRVVFSPPGGIATFDFIAGSLVTVRDESGRERIEKLENLRERDATGREIMTISKFNGRNILFKDWPCLTRLHGKKDKKTGKYEKEAETYFPLEFLSIAPHQRVPLAKQLAEPEAAERPGARMRKIMAGMEALNLHNGGRSNPWMEAFGIHISIRPLTVTGIRRATPHLQFGGQRGVAQISDDKVNWRTGDKQFIEGGHIDELIIFFNDATNEDEMYRLFKEIQRAAGMKRLTIKEGSAIRVNQEDIMKEMCNIFEARKQEEQKCKREKRIVLLYVDPLHIKSHSPLKLFERRYLIVTQHLTLEVAKKLLRNDRSTMENVLLKLNMKAGGTNYEVQAEKFAHKTWLRNSKTMVIGIDVAHATNLSQHERMRQEHQNPSSIGFSFNGHKRADRFIGDYHFTFTNKEIVDSRVLNSRIKWMLEVFKRERGFLPDHILITRDGVSEGQHQYLLDELDALREGAAEFGNMIKKEYKPRLTFVLATKRHNHRFLQEARGRNGESTFTNAPPGTVVDTVVTRPEMTSFFLQAHYPLQGTAKSTAYRVIADDYGYKMDELQAFVNALCFEHQVSTGAISIPAPIYQADEWAKRGYDNFKYYRQLGLKLALTTEGLIDTEEMTKRLAYWRTRLELVRSNA